MFWNAGVGASITRPKSSQHLSRIGRIVEKAIHEIPKRYPNIRLDNYVVMPNHVHLLITLCADERGRVIHAPTTDISKVVQQLKNA